MNKINNWQTKKLGEILKISSGTGLTKSKRNDGGKYLVYGGNGVTGKHDEYLFDDEKLIIGRVGVHCGNAYITRPKSWVTDNAFVVTFNEDEINKKFLLNLIRILNLNKYSVSTAQPVISQRTIYPIEIALPPLETQHAIVSKIEELFSELDKGIAELKTAQQQLKTYRQSVLKSAFEGKLTNENVKDGELPDDWEIKKLNQVAKIISGFAFKSSDFISKGIPVVKISNIGYSEFIWKDQQYLPEKFLISNSDFILKNDDLLIALTRPITNNTTKICLYPKNTNIGLLNQRVACIKEIQLNKKYLFLYFQTNNFKEYIRTKFSETLQPNLSPKDLAITPIPLPSPEEQNRIVQEIESRLSVADKMEQSIQESLQKAETLRQSILKKAFCGELV
ncbi:restriction endonuclease subunit S [uncultured Chryseobacterium sp.]|uniref:restriction endonuclease subunit S n=1 Tax=uncultured Chryseobacterium sp. TaxID=259322 RepID=UPI0025876B20|nr:restriction endonuclease subunit S [uncultured Chryseobacterium sp.]